MNPPSMDRFFCPSFYVLPFLSIFFLFAPSDMHNSVTSLLPLSCPSFVQFFPRVLSKPQLQGSLGMPKFTIR